MMTNQTLARAIARELYSERHHRPQASACTSTSNGDDMITNTGLARASNQERYRQRRTYAAASSEAAAYVGRWR